MFLDRIEKLKADDKQRFFEMIRGLPDCASLAGNVFERFVHEAMAAPGEKTFTLKPLSGGEEVSFTIKGDVH